MASRIPNTHPFTTLTPSYIPLFQIPTITTNYIHKQLGDLLENKAIGQDRLPGRFLWAAISQHLNYSFNFSLYSRNFITEWKHAKVLPIFKSDSSSETNNYIPLSHFTILSKFFECLVHYIFTENMEHHNLLTFGRSGFGRKHSNVISHIHITHWWLHYIDNGFVMGVVFVDSRKAFDNVDVNMQSIKIVILAAKRVSGNISWQGLPDRYTLCILY